MRLLFALAVYPVFLVSAMAQTAKTPPVSPVVTASNGSSATFSLNPQDVGKTVVLMQRGSSIVTLEVTFDHAKQAELKQLVADHPNEDIQILLEGKLVDQKRIKPPTGHSIKIRTYKTPDDAFVEAKRLLAPIPAGNGSPAAVTSTGTATALDANPPGPSVVFSLDTKDVTDVAVFMWKGTPTNRMDIGITPEKQAELTKIVANNPNSNVQIVVEGKTVDQQVMKAPVGRSVKIKTYKTPDEAFAEAKRLLTVP